MEPSVVRPPAEIDVSTAAGLDELLRPCDPEGATVVDFGGVTFCDSTGIGVLIRHAVRHIEAGGTLRVESAGSLIRRTFTIAGVAEILGVTDSTGA